MVVDTCCQELRERERERVADQAWFSQWPRENSDHHRQFDLEERCLLALGNHHFRKIIAVFSSSLPPFFLFFYSKILNCNSTQNIYNCSLSFHATSNPWIPSARIFSGLRFCFKLHLKWSPFANVTSEIRHAPTQNKLLSFAPERLGYVALNLLNSPSQ
jgi:hypothetical protein